MSRQLREYNPDKLLQNICWIAGISIAAILVFTSISVFELTSQEVKRDAMEMAVKVSQSMFEQRRDVLLSNANLDRYELHLDQADISTFDKYSRTFLRNFNILKIKIYTPDHRIIFSTDSNVIGKTNDSNSRLLKALSGDIDSHVEKKDEMLDLANETKFKVDVVETYVPIRSGEKVIGVFELYTDVTDYNREIYSVVTKIVLCLAVILLMVFYCSYRFIRKMTGVLKKTQQELADKVIQLEDALTKVNQLEGIIPICSYCKKIRDDEKSWHQLEQYISDHSEARFSHGICPECQERVMLEINAMSL